MPLRPQPISWPLAGGLDTDTGPLSVVPGSHLTLDNVIQERRDEWRARNGTTVSAQDTMPNGIAPMLGKVGDAGMFGLNTTLATYQPSLTSNRWTNGIAPSGLPTNCDISRVPIVATDNPVFGFAQTGNLCIIANLDSVAPAVVVFDAQGKTHTKVALPAGTYIRARCAATSGKLVAYLADSSGNLNATIVDAATGAISGGVIKTGIHGTAPYLDAQWDGTSSTITVVVRLSTDAVRFMEHNPSTNALSTDVTLSGVVANSALSLFQDYSASGVRFVGMADTTGPTVRVLRVTSAGSVSTNTLVNNTTAATAITGVGWSSGANWSAVYIDTSASKGLHVARLLGGSLGDSQVVAAGTLNVPMSLDGQAWSADGSTFQFLIGYHSQSTSDPQDSWQMAAMTLTNLTNALHRNGRIAPLQAQAYMLGSTTTQSALFQRAGAGSNVSKFCLPVLSAYSLTAGVATRQYSIDIFTQQLLGSGDISATVNQGFPTQYKQTSFVPGPDPSFLDEGCLSFIGSPIPPPQPVGSAAGAGAGGLTLLGTYNYVDVWEFLDSDGNVWRSPPSVPFSITLTGTQSRVNFTDVESIGIGASSFQVQRFRLKRYRTANLGTTYRLIAIVSGTALDGFQPNISDGASDASIANSEILYTTGELATAITPRFSHMATFGDRLWGINADFRTELWPSKNLRPGRQPEFVEEGVVDIDDNYGDLTGIVGLDGNGVAFKRTAIYFITGDGLTDAGSGQAHTYQQVVTGIGAIPGSPLVVAGDRVFFVSDRGIYAIDRGANITYIGAGVDKYFNQPQIQTAERVYDGVFMPKQNEIRFVTTNYILVYDLKYETWTRWTGLSGMRRCLLINDRMVLFKTDGTVWREGDESVTTDNGTPYNGIIRSAWVRPTDFGQIRLYRGLALGERTAGGGNVTPTMQIYEDNSDTPVQSFSPPSPIGGLQSVIQAEARPQQQNCSAFSLQVTLPPSDVTTRLAKWGAEIGVRGGRAQKRVAGESWR